MISWKSNWMDKCQLTIEKWARLFCRYSYLIVQNIVLQSLFKNDSRKLHTFWQEYHSLQYTNHASRQPSNVAMEHAFQSFGAATRKRTAAMVAMNGTVMVRPVTDVIAINFNVFGWNVAYREHGSAIKKTIVAHSIVRTRTQRYAQKKNARPILVNALVKIVKVT